MANVFVCVTARDCAESFETQARSVTTTIGVCALIAPPSRDVCDVRLCIRSHFDGRNCVCTAMCAAAAAATAAALFAVQSFTADVRTPIALARVNGTERNGSRVR